jgi:hypothetical protein
LERLLAALLGLVTPAVGLAQRSSVARRDSAGISVITHAAEAAAQRYVLQRQGTELGVTPGAELTRVVNAVRMPSGRVIVADGGRRQILSFAPNGTLERILARDGSGPGEFQIIRSMLRHGRDSIVAHDGRQVRFAVFTDSGFVRQVRFEKSEHLFLAETSLIGLLDDGRAVVTSGGAIPLGDPGPARMERVEFPLVSYSADGRPGRLLGRYPGNEHEIVVIQQGPLTGGFSRRLRLFGATSMFALSGRNIIVANSALPGFDVLDTTGRLIRRVRSVHTPSAVQQSHMEAYADERVSAISDAARKTTLRAEHANTSHAPVFPALDERILIDAAQRVWLGSYKRPGDREQTWWVFALDGALLSQLTVPAALTVTDAGTDYVLGVWRDADGVQTIRQYRLVPSR